MGWMPCLECCGCWEWTDDFDRSNSTNVGSSWSEQTGDWEILSNELHEKNGGGGTSNALLVATTPVPADSAGGMYCKVTIVDFATGSHSNGDKWYLYLGTTDTGSGGFTAEFERLSTSSVGVTVSGGGATPVSKTLSVTTVDDIDVYACLHTNGVFKASVISGVGEYPWISAATATTNRYYALGHDNTSNGATFDDFYVTEESHNNIICYTCMCPCLNYILPHTLTATVYNATYRSSCMDAETFTMTWEWNAGVERWRGDHDFYAPGLPGAIQNLEFALYCSTGADSQDRSWPGKNFTLYNLDNNCCVSGSGNCGPLQAHYTSTCDPVSLKFGPFIMAYSEGTCYVCQDPLTGETTAGNYYIEITE